MVKLGVKLLECGCRTWVMMVRGGAVATINKIAHFHLLDFAFFTDVQGFGFVLLCGSVSIEGDADIEFAWPTYILCKNHFFFLVLHNLLLSGGASRM